MRIILNINHKDWRQIVREMKANGVFGTACLNDLPCFELNLDEFVTDGFGEREYNTVLLLGEGEAGLVEVGLDVVQLRVVLILVLDLLLERLCQLLDSLLNRSSVAREGSLAHHHHVSCTLLLTHHLEE